MSTIKSLIARLDAATGPNVAIDADLQAVLGLPPPNLTVGGSKSITRYTRSLEHAAWAVERWLPGWGWVVTSKDKDGKHEATLWATDGSDFEGRGATPALALLRAALSVEE